MRFLIALVLVVACDKGDGKSFTNGMQSVGDKPAAAPTAAPTPAAPAPAAPTPTAPAPAPVETAPTVTTAAWKDGDKIQGKWSDGRWYNGRISAVNGDGTYNIKYDDGDVSNHFGKERIRARGTVTPSTGGQSHAGGGGNAPCPGPGLTRRCGGVCVNIQEDNNNCGSCGTRCSGGKHCDGHMFCRDAAGNL